MVFFTDTVYLTCQELPGKDVSSSESSHIIADKEAKKDTIGVIKKETNHLTVSENRININTALVAELIKLKGIGPKTAEKIIIYRKEHGSFTCVEDLLKVKGIGSKKLQKIRDLIIIK